MTCTRTDCTGGWLITVEGKRPCPTCRPAAPTGSGYVEPETLRKLREAERWQEWQNEKQRLARERGWRGNVVYPVALACLLLLAGCAYSGGEFRCAQGGGGSWTSLRLGTDTSASIPACQPGTASITSNPNAATADIVRQAAGDLGAVARALAGQRLPPMLVAPGAER